MKINSQVIILGILIGFVFGSIFLLSIPKPKKVIEIKSQPQVLIITKNWVSRVTGDIYISVIDGKNITARRIN